MGQTRQHQPVDARESASRLDLLGKLALIVVAVEREKDLSLIAVKMYSFHCFLFLHRLPGDELIIIVTTHSG